MEDSTWTQWLDRTDILICDTETTGLGKEDEIIEIALVDTTGELRFYSKVLPSVPISEEALRVHGISEQELLLEGAPRWKEIESEVFGVLAEATIILGWNISFDKRILEQTSCRVIEDEWYDLLKDYRRMECEKGESASLSTVTQYLNIEHSVHNAVGDCQAVLEVMRRHRDIPILPSLHNVFTWRKLLNRQDILLCSGSGFYMETESSHIALVDTTGVVVFHSEVFAEEIQEKVLPLLQRASLIVGWNIYNERRIINEIIRVNTLRGKWYDLAKAHRNMEQPPVRYDRFDFSEKNCEVSCLTMLRVMRELQDIPIKLEEKGSHPSSIVEKVETNLSPINDPQPRMEYEGKRFCFTGTFEWGKRKDCEEKVKNLGGRLGGINKSLDYLVVGKYESESWIHGQYGRKIEKAMELRQNFPVAIISEEHWVASL